MEALDRLDQDEEGKTNVIWPKQEIAQSLVFPEA